MTIKEELEKEIETYKHQILEIQKQIFEYQKNGKPERDYCHLMSEEKFLGSIIMFNNERLDKLARE